MTKDVSRVTIVVVAVMLASGRAEKVKATVEDSSEVRARAFFVADEGKSIRLPMSGDVVYDPETGDIRIRNLNHAREYGRPGNKQNYYSIRSEDPSFKNLQGFFIADGERGYARHYTYPSGSASEEEVREQVKTTSRIDVERIDEEQQTETPSPMAVFPAVRPGEKRAENHTDDPNVRIAKQYESQEENRRYDDEATEEMKAYTEDDALESIKRNPDLFSNNDHLSIDDPMMNNVSEVQLDSDDLASETNSSETIEEDPIFITTTEPLDPLSALRAYMEDIYLRGPIAVVVDAEEGSLAMAREALSAMERIGGVLNITDVVLIAYDADGITWMSHHKAATAMQREFETRSFMKALNGLKVSKTSGRSLPALMKASWLLPYDSAIFLFSNRENDVERTDEENSLFVGQLLTKRIKFYVVCGGSGEICRGGAARASGGGRVHLREKRSEPKYSKIDRQESSVEIIYDVPDETPDSETLFEAQDVLVARKGMSDVETVDFPVDSGVKTLTISISGSPEKVTLQTSTGEQINLLNQASVERYSSNSEILSLSPTAAVRIDMDRGENSTNAIGGVDTIWKLTVKGSNSTPYNVQIDAETTVHIHAKVLTQYSGPRAGSRNVRISIGGGLASVSRASVINEHGKIIGNLTTYRYQAPSTNDVIDIETLRAEQSGVASKIVPLPAQTPRDQAFYIQIEGLNDKDEQILRLSQELQIPVDDVANLEKKLGEMIDRSSGEDTIGRGLANIESSERAYNNYNNNNFSQSQGTTYDGLPMTTIQIGSASRLYGAPGTQMQIHFEVTNNRPNSVFFRYYAKDDQYFLRTLTPQSQWIGGKQTVNVILTVGITTNAENNIRDSIMFQATGLDQTTINAYVYVVTDGRIDNDRTRPELKYSYRGDCLGYLSSGCETRTWGLDITAKDTESGLLRITSTPHGIVYGSGFYAGGREEVYARFTASCCTHRVNLIAVDLNGNVQSYDPDVSMYLSPALIAAIVLGVLLFIALIVVIVLIVRWVCKRKRDSRELPSYQTQRVT